MQKSKVTEQNDSQLIADMVKAGFQYGFSKSKRNPSVSSYIHTTKNRVDIINLEKTSELLQKATEFVAHLGEGSKNILFVGTKAEAKDAIVSVASSLNMPYVSERWIGGTLSNYSEIKKRIAELEKYQKESKTGELEKYTKKERVVLAKKMERLEKYYTGLLTLKKNPEVLIVIDPKKESIAVTEARDLGIPVIALANTDTNIKGIDFPVVGNDGALLSIKFFLNHLKNAYGESKKA
jgi:small subunit ribosomal protein S2